MEKFFQHIKLQTALVKERESQLVGLTPPGRQQETTRAVVKTFRVPRQRHEPQKKELMIGTSLRSKPSAPKMTWSGAEEDKPREKVFGTDTSDRALVSKIEKEPLKLNKKTTMH